MVRNHSKYTPKIGSFEVIYDQKIIHSKLQSKKWPNTQLIITKIKNISDSYVPFSPSILN